MRFVAAAAVLACACGSSQPSTPLDSHTIDGTERPLDAGLDAFSLPGSADVTIYDSQHHPIPGMPVAFQHGNGDVIATATTDASGAATATISAGTVVTVQRTPTTYFTWLGVKPGDHLVLGTPAATGGSTELAVTLPPVASADDYTIAASCPGAVGTATPAGNGRLFVPAGCTTADVFAEARDTDKAMLAWMFAPGVSLTGASLDLSASALSPPTAVPFTLEHVNPNQATPVVEADLVRDQLRFSDSVGQGGMFELAAVADSTLEVTIATTNLASHGRIAITDRVPAAKTYDFDFDQHQIPLVTFPVAKPTQLAWSETGDGEVNVVGGSVKIARASGTVEWTLVGPPNSVFLFLPNLPASLDVLNRLPTDTLSIGHVLFLARVDGGYDTIRNTVMNRGALTDAMHAGAGGALSFPQNGSLPDE